MFSWMADWFIIKINLSTVNFFKLKNNCLDEAIRNEFFVWTWLGHGC